jgi:hypothetical protein
MPRKRRRSLSLRRRNIKWLGSAVVYASTDVVDIELDLHTLEGVGV